MGRKKDREKAFQLIYQTEINKDDFRDQLDLFFNENPMSVESVDYITDVVTGVNMILAEIDGALEKHLTSSWKLDRISKVDLAILRLGYFEIRYRDDVPKSAAINEAVELAKAYGSDSSGKFVNGILAHID
ncbi:MAG TPA: transcription antitermination factor NusB [Clostridia bacterium]|nr:transcription antitermination factor NusB [Clostridia bacterium]HPQ45749.1 transcription antitermination factor NusB [Clostridia bacterium]HRX42489.1 transcription antitermination factor NusB [Clostridia bacterium]